MDRTADLGDDGQRWPKELLFDLNSKATDGLYFSFSSILQKLCNSGQNQLLYYHSFVWCFCVFFHQVVTLMKHGYTIDLIW